MVASGIWMPRALAGEQLINPVAAKKPLFSNRRPDIETGRDYIASLSTAINAVPQGGSAAATLFFNLRD